MPDYFRFTCAARPRRFGTTPLERRLVLSPGDGIEPVIYCTSIRQRERNCFRQLYVAILSLRSKCCKAPRAYVHPLPAVKTSQALLADVAHKSGAKVRFFLMGRTMSPLFFSVLMRGKSKIG